MMRELTGNRAEYILVPKSQLCWDVSRLGTGSDNRPVMIQGGSFEKCSCSKPRNHIYY